MLELWYAVRWGGLWVLWPVAARLDLLVLLCEMLAASKQVRLQE
jgi:hypothetical protein